MAKDETPSRSKIPPGDNSTVIDFDALGDVGEFVTPEDVVGDDLAAELQKVLDEAKSQLDIDLTVPLPARVAPPVAPPPVAAVPVAIDEETLDADAEFESPADVLGTASSEATAPPVMAEEDPAEFEAQLKQLLELAASGDTGGAQPPAAEPEPSIDATTAQAQAMLDEIKQMTAMVNGAVAIPAVTSQATADDSPGFSEEEIAKMAAELLEPSAPASPSANIKTFEPTQPKAAPVSPQSLSQLDEYLAGHADNAVADAFDTVSEVIAEQQAAMETPEAAITSEAATPATIDDEFSSPEQVYDNAAPAAAPLMPTQSQGTAPRSEKVAAPRAAVAAAAPLEPSGETASIATVRKSKPSAGQMVRKVIVVTTAAAYGFCRVVNSPLKNASESTRKTIGYVGLLTLTNASLLILGKLLSSLMG